MDYETDEYEDMIDLPQILSESYPPDIERGPDKSFRVSPTRLLKCQRGAFMESIGYKEPLSPQSHMNFEYGIMRHKVIQDKLLDLKMVSNVEEEITWDDPQLLGFMDARLITPRGDAVLEIKTTSVKPHLIREPMYTHAEQCQLYMHMTGLHEAYLLYESKGTKDSSNPWTQIIVNYDQEIAEQLLNRGRALLTKLNKRIIPMPDSDCRFCKNPACFDTKIHKNEGLKGFIV